MTDYPHCKHCAWGNDHHPDGDQGHTTPCFSRCHEVAGRKTPCGPAEKAAVARRWLMGHGNTLNELERHTGWRMSRYIRTDDLFAEEAS